MQYPKISIVTPVFNQVEYIEQAITSVLNQGYPELEYIIVDGGSTDGTLEILRRYEPKISKLISEADSGMYEALYKGFSYSTGEIMAWINADDIFLPEAFKNMTRLFNDLPTVEWIQGLNSFIDLETNLIDIQPPKKFSLIKFLNRDFKWVQQESTFWRRRLWDRAGSKIDTGLKYAGDFELWLRFFKYSKLYNSSLPIGAWRRRRGQLSAAFMDEYLDEVNFIIESTLSNDEDIKHNIRQLEKKYKVYTLLHKLNLVRGKFLKHKRDKYNRLKEIEISYSYEQRKFIIN